jgi:hypothetical protein
MESYEDQEKDIKDCFLYIEGLHGSGRYKSELKLHVLLNRWISCTLVDNEIERRYHKEVVDQFKKQQKTTMLLLAHQIKLICHTPKYEPNPLLAKRILNSITEEQKEIELLLEEVLRSKTNIDGLIENKIRSFIYYNIKLI